MFSDMFITKILFTDATFINNGQANLRNMHLVSRKFTQLDERIGHAETLVYKHLGRNS